MDNAAQIFKKEQMISVSRFAKKLGGSRSFAYDLCDKGPRNGGVVAFHFGIVRDKKFRTQRSRV